MHVDVQLCSSLLPPRRCTNAPHATHAASEAAGLPPRVGGDIICFCAILASEYPSTICWSVQPDPLFLFLCVLVEGWRVKSKHPAAVFTPVWADPCWQGSRGAHQLLNLHSLPCCLCVHCAVTHQHLCTHGWSLSPILCDQPDPWDHQCAKDVTVFPSLM